MAYGKIVTDEIPKSCFLMCKCAKCDQIAIISYLRYPNANRFSLVNTFWFLEHILN